MSKRLTWTVIVAAVLIGLVWVWNHRMGVPDDFDHMEAQYKYGSIGADHPLAMAPLPYWIWRVLPDVLPPATTIPNGMAPRNGQPGWAAFGLVTEKNAEKPSGWVEGQPLFERPIGFSKRRTLGIDLVGMNCAFCHTGVVRSKPGAEPLTILGGVGNTVDIEQYFLYLFNAMTNERFTADVIMPAVDKELARQGAELGWLTRALYRYVVIPIVPKYLKSLEKNEFDFLFPNDPANLPGFGPGRVDTWSLYKRVFGDPPEHAPIPGIVDFPSIWNQKARAGLRMHWDGNTDVLVERDVISALGLIGHRVQYLDYDRLSRITDWIIGLLPPRFIDHQPEGIPPLDPALVARGGALFGQHCAQCHAAGGDRLGLVEPIADLGTDPNRMNDFSAALARGLNQLGTSQWQLRHFKPQNGYVNALLDGLWLRAPYLHNGSVPTLRDLLAPPNERPQRFCRGGDVFDWKNVGFVTPGEMKNGKLECPTSFLLDVATPGNSNAGHFYGTDLAPADKDALVEFLKTF